jgi:phosphatidylglycerophosphate synthase
MLDRLALRIVKPATDAAATWLAARAVTANQVTLAGFGFGLAAAVLIAAGFTAAAILPLLINRTLDGIDGALARLTRPSERGAFLDIALDFLFYAAIPLAFAAQDPTANALAAAFLATGTSFLAFAVMAEKRRLKSADYPSKSFYYLGGLTEGTETIACFVIMCAWPQYFAFIAYAYGALCVVTTATRLYAGWRMFD